MYLSFCEELREEAQNKEDLASEIEEAVAEAQEEALEELREEATRILFEKAEYIIDQFDINNPFEEARDEIEDVMRDYLVDHF